MLFLEFDARFWSAMLLLECDAPASLWNNRRLQPLSAIAAKQYRTAADEMLAIDHRWYRPTAIRWNGTSALLLRSLEATEVRVHTVG